MWSQKSVALVAAQKGAILIRKNRIPRAHPRIVQPLRNARKPPCRPTLRPTRISAVPAAWLCGGQPSLRLLLPHMPTEVNMPPRIHAAPPKVLSAARRPVQAASCGAMRPQGARRGGVAREHFRGSDGFLTPVRTGERYARASKICRGRPRNAGRASIAAQRP